MNVFWNARERRLRAGWRLILQALMMAILGVLPILLIAEPLTALHRRGVFLAGLNHDAYDRVINMIVGPLLAIAVVASVVIAARVLDHRPLTDFGIRFDRAWWRGLALGAAIGALLMTIIFVIELGAGWVRITGHCKSTVAGVSFLLACSFTIVKVCCVGIYEELVSRGYMLRNLADGLNLPIAIIGSSAIFAALHATNDNATVWSTASLFFAGLLLAAAVLLTGRLSTAIGLHIAWNLFEGLVYGFPVSGDKEGASLLLIDQRGPVLVTGGAFGPEAGMIGIAATVIGIGVLWWMRQRDDSTRTIVAS